MPYTIEWKTTGVIWTFHGVLTSQDAIQANLDIYGDPRFDDLQYQIVDISTVEEFEVSNEALEEAAAMDQAAAISSPRLLVAVVAPNETAQEVAESYKSAMENSTWEVQIFMTLDDAMKCVRAKS